MRLEMLNPHLLLLFSEFDSADALMDTLLDAVAHAARPASLHFAIPQALWDAFASIQLPQGTLREGSAKPYDDSADLSTVLPLLTDETHILTICGPHGFAERWDRTLTARFALITAKRAVMTGCIVGEGVHAECCLPSFQPDFREQGVLIGAGYPLVCSAAPVQTMALSPAFVFAPVGFLRDASTARSTLSIAAYACGYAVFTLDRPVLWALDHRRKRRLYPPAADAFPQSSLKRFEQLSGVSFALETVGYRATVGLFCNANTYAQHAQDDIRRRLRSLRARRLPKPMFVSAFVELPDALHPQQEYMLRFGFLAAIQSLPLVLYAGGPQERLLRACFPNTLAYPDHSLLPRSLLGEGMSCMQLFQRNKALLLKRVLRAYPTFKHIAWVDADALPHPVDPQASLDFTALMDDRIHIATVNGEPDLTCMVMPRAMARLLAREVQSQTQLDSEMKRSFSPARMFKRLMEKLPDVFALHPMPAKGLLFLSGFEPTLLSMTIQQLLLDLPPVIRPILVKEKKHE